MKKIRISQIHGYLVGQAILAFIGALLLLVDDFAGYYYRDYYNHIDVWGDIYLGSDFLGSVLILIGIGSLSFSLYFAVKTLRLKNEVPVSLVKENVKKSIKGGIFAAGLAGISALIFIISNVIEQTQEWWLDSGFYGAFIGGLLVAYFGKMIIDSIDSKRST